MKPFRVTGRFDMGRIPTPFTIETIGADESAARDRVYSTIGSKHRVNRHGIKIESVTELTPDQLTDPVIEKKLSLVK